MCDIFKVNQGTANKGFTDYSDSKVTLINSGEL